MIGIYLDIQNITGNKLKQPDVIMSTGIIENPSAPVAEQRYKMKYLKQESGTILPTLGINCRVLANSRHKNYFPYKKFCFLYINPYICTIFNQMCN